MFDKIEIKKDTIVFVISALVFSISFILIMLYPERLLLSTLFKIEQFIFMVIGLFFLAEVFLSFRNPFNRSRERYNPRDKEENA
jgi:hypothetical protein